MAEIILMEDSPPLRRLLMRYLRDADHTVQAFDTGIASENAAMLEHADVVVTDLSMPGVDGYAVLQNTQRIAPDLPVIVMTGDNPAPSPLLDRAFGYLRKPFDETAFLSLIERAAAKRLHCTHKKS